MEKRQKQTKLLCQKSKKHAIYDPDRTIKFTVIDKNLEYHQGEDAGWASNDIPSAEDNQEEEAFLIDIAIKYY